MKENTKALVDTSKEVGLAVNIHRMKYVPMSRHQNAGEKS
jgi:hypothetical protein